VNQTNIADYPPFRVIRKYASLCIVLINPNEQKKPNVFEPSKNGSPLGQKMDEPWAYVPADQAAPQASVCTPFL
jgi:hypothetical protein